MITSRLRVVVAMVLAAAFLECVKADEQPTCNPAACECRTGLMLCCPDDYCTKLLPCPIHPGPCRCPDCYCRKPAPCLVSPGRFCCDDYCPKPVPCLCWPKLPVPYSCGAAPHRGGVPLHDGNGKK